MCGASVLAFFVLVRGIDSQRAGSILLEGVMGQQAEYQQVEKTSSGRLYKASREDMLGRVLLFMVALLLSMLLLSVPSLAAGNLSVTRTINVAEDATLDSGASGDNYGGSTYLQVESKSEFHSILRTSLASIIPTSSNVSSATLYLYYYDGTKDAPGRTYYIDRLTETDWVEGISDGATETGAVDWDYRQHDTLSWTSAGGTYDITDEATGTVPGAFGWMSITVTGLVQYAVTNGVNAEWVIRDPGTDVTNQWAHFYSSEGTTVPYLSVTFTAPWDSYKTSARTEVWGDAGNEYDDQYNTVYMKGTGFATDNHTVGYYDATVSGGGYLVASEDVAVGVSGNLTSLYYFPTADNATAGLWHALGQPASGYSSLPSDYNTAVASPDTYGLLANDSFTVEASAIPEFPAVIAGIVVAGTCFGIYYWMRKRRLAYVRVKA